MNAAATLEMIKRRFAGRDTDLERVFTTSESFRGLCTDYLACASALARWRESSAEEAPLRVGEYSELLRELTKEIQSRLSPTKGPGVGGGSRTTNQPEEGRPR